MDMHRTVLLASVALFVATLLITTVLMPHTQPTGLAIELQPETANVQIGQPIRVDIQASSVSDLAGVEFNISYNDATLNYNGFSEGTFLNESGTVSTYVPDTINSATPGEVGGIVIVRLNDTGASGSGTIGSLYFTATSDGTSNIQFIEALLSDSNGDSISETFVNTTITIGSGATDTQNPTVSISNPVNGSTVSGTVSITATADDNVGVTSVSFYDGQMIIDTDNTPPYTASWTTIELPDSNRAILAIAEDAEGNKGYDSVSVTVSNTGPSVSLTTPSAESHVRQTIQMNATASDAEGISYVEFYAQGQLRTNDSTAPYTGTLDTTTISDGPATLQARAVNVGGAANTAEHDVIVDNTAPTLVINSPSEFSNQSGQTSINITLTEQNLAAPGVGFLIDGNNLGFDLTSPYRLSWNTTEVVDGAHTITVQASDEAGNSGSKNIQVNTDNTAPTISITSPTSASTISDAINITADVSDANGVTTVIYYVDEVEIGRDSTSPYSLSWNTTTVNNGNHTVVVGAIDTFSNVGLSQEVNVTTDNGELSDTTAPSVSITAPNDGDDVSGTVTITADASDDNAVVGVLFSIDGTALATEDTSAPYSVSWNTDAISDGDHTITARARDLAGNTKTDEIVVTKPAPASSGGSSSGGGGGGGGGGSSGGGGGGGAYASIYQAQQKQEEEQEQKSPTLLQTQGIGIFDRVEVLLKIINNEATMSATRLAADQVSDLPNTFKLSDALLITTKNIYDDEYDEITIDFVVTDEWMQQQNISKEDVVLMHRGADGWEEIPSNLQLSYEGNNVYSAAPAQTGMYAVGTLKEPIPEPVQTQEPAQVEEPSNGLPGGWIAGILALIALTISAPFILKATHKKPVKKKSSGEKSDQLAQLRAYVSAQRAAGKSDDDIRTELEKAGWTDDEFGGVI